MKSSLRLAALALAAASVVACDDGSGNPLAPGTNNPSTTSNGTEQITGTIQSISPPSTLVVAGRSILTNGGTVIRQSGLPLAFGDLRTGLAVSISAMRQGSTVTASTIDVTSGAGAVGTPTTLRGEVEEVSGTADDFTLRVDGRTVRGNGASVIKDGSRQQPFDELNRGDEIEVDGLAREAYVYAEAVDVLNDVAGDDSSPVPNPPGPGPDSDPDPDDPPSDSETTVTVDGKVSVLTGACPLLVLTVDEEPVITTALTDFEAMACVDLSTGDRIEVTGTREGGGLPIVAASIRRQ